MLYSVLLTGSGWKKGILVYLDVCVVPFSQNLAFSFLLQTNELKNVGCIFLPSDRPVAQSSADQPKNLTLDEGAIARFTCKTIGNPPTETLKWQFNGKDIPGESCSGCSITTFVKTSVTLSDVGWYSCTGTNSLGEGPPARAQLLIKRK